MQSDNKLISLLPFFPSYTVGTHLGTEMSWVCLGFFFQLKGGTGGLSVLFCQRVFLSFSNSVLRQFVSPSIFLKFHDSPAKSNRACWGTAAPHALHSCALLLPHVQVCARVCTLILSVLWQNSWRYTFKKKNEKKIIKKIRARWQLTVLRKLWKTVRNMKCIVMVIFSYILWWVGWRIL